MATAGCGGESEEEEEEQEGTMEVGVREFQPDHQLTQAVQSSRNITLKGEINMGGSINKMNKYEDHRVYQKTQIVCGDINVTNAQNLTVHHGDVHHVTNIIQPEITTEEGRTKNLINSDADVFVETSLYRQALNKLTGPGCVLLVTGPTKCGKSCLGHALLRHFTEDGYTPLVVNSVKAMSHIAKDKKHAILIDIEGFGEKFEESEVRKLCKMAQDRNSLIIFTLHESCLSQDWDGDGDGEGARAHGAFQSLKISRSSTYCKKEKAEMLRKHLGREKKPVDEGLLKDVVTTETCGYLFPLRCLQYAEVVDDKDCSYDPIMLFKHLEDIIQCARLEPVTVIEIQFGNVSLVSESESELWYNFVTEDCRHRSLKFVMYCKNLQNPDLDKPVSEETPLLKACRTSDIGTVEELLKSKQEKPNHQTHQGLTPLHLACLAGSEAIVNLLLESGAKAVAVDSDGLTPLHCACRQDNPAVVESIIKAFNVPAPPDADRLVLKCTSGHQELVKALRACTLNKNMASSSTSLNVCTTCLAQCRPALDNVRRHNHNINMRIMQKFHVERPTALHIACMFSHLEAVKRLLENGACTELSFSLHDLQRMPFYVCSTPLVLSCALGLTDVVQLLLKHKACGDPLHDVTALHVASYYGRSNVVQLLLDNGADAEVKDIDGNLPLHQAVLCKPCDLPNLSNDQNHFKVCQLLLNKMRAEAVNAKNKAKRCPLYEACVRNDMDTVRLLVEHGADVNQAADGEAPLHIACEKGHTELVQLLIHLGADVDKQLTSWRNISVCSPLRIACARCHADIVELLLKNNCKVDYVSEHGETLLHDIGTRQEDYGSITEKERLRRGGDSYASAETIAKLLLDTGDIDVNSSGFTGTPLQHFCDLGHLGIVTLLLKHKALVNPPQPHKKYHQQIDSPLQLAVKFSIESAAQNRDEWREEAEEIIHLLLQHDASVATLFDQEWHVAQGCPLSQNYELKGVNQPVLRYLGDGTNAKTSTAILCRMFERGITTPDSEDNTYRVQAGEHILKKETALHLACMLCRQDVVKTLLDEGADLSARDGNDMTPLMALCVYSYSCCCYYRQSVEQILSILRILVERGADMYSEDTKGRLPVQELSRGQLDLQKLLDAKVVSVDGTDRQVRTLLHQLCAKSLQVPDVSVTYGVPSTNVSSVTVLINAGANVNTRDHNGDTPLHLACMQGHVAAVQDLLSHKDLKLKANNEGKTPLDVATELEDVSLRTQLLQMLQSFKNASEELPAADVKSVQINSQAPDYVEANSQREEPAACAVSRDVPEIASEDVQGKGLSQTASLTSQSCEKATQTHEDLLASAGHVTLQPDQGVANVQLQSVESQDATHSSQNKPGQVDQWSLQLVDDMLTSGVPVDSLVDGEGLSPLHYACKEGDLHLAERLLSAAVDVNKSDVTGRTAVHFASERGDVMMLDLLLHHGCDVRVKDN